MNAAEAAANVSRARINAARDEASTAKIVA